jgi:stage II sporulation protein M
LLPRYLILKRPTSTVAGVLRFFLVSSFRRCWFLYFAAFLIIVAGFAWGLESASQLDPNETVQLEDYLARLATPDTTEEKGSVFRQAIMRNTVPVGVIYVAGLTVIGMPVVAGVLFLRGYALGFTTGFLVRQKGVYGLGLVLAEILPQNVLLLAVFLFAAVASFSFSLLLLRRGFNPATPVFPSFLRYTGMMIAGGVVALGAAVVEAYVVPGIAQVVLPMLEE